MNKSHSAWQTSYKAEPKAPVGAVMVVGAGISGIQASLDLADQGFLVYLVEKQSAIGGHMAQLDKTFPTNDCAMCSISPNLVKVGRHPNIQLLMDSEVLDVTGEAGNFSVTLNCKPRYIDINKCISCGDCAMVCPISIPDNYEQNLNERKAAYLLYTQAVPSAYSIDKLGTAPCKDACPAGQRAQGYIALIAQGRYREALSVIKKDNPFPSVCGRTCHHPCENKCTRSLIDRPVNIMALKRFVTDYALAYGRDKILPVPRTRSEWVAIVGAGPAGLTAAHDLVKLGFGVTVYEALPVPGGMMRVGIPAHRLPKGVLQQDIDDIVSLGVVLKTNSPIINPKKLLEQGYNAVCLATGISTRKYTLDLEGEDAAGVILAATFLRKINLGEPITIGERIAVIGGGITALDAAAVSCRLGSKDVFLILDRPRGELPAYHWELEAIEAEGIHLVEHTKATRILTKEGKVVGIELTKTRKDTDHSLQEKEMTNTADGKNFVIDVDTVIGTVGQFSDLNFLDPDFEDLKVDEKTFASEIPGLFVVGGRKTGASYIIQAVSLGHQVANSIYHYLQDEPLNQPLLTKIQVAKLSSEDIEQKIKLGKVNFQPRIESSLIPTEERVTSFREVVLGLTEHQAKLEAQRCLQCGNCSECMICVDACGVNAIDHTQTNQEKKLSVGAIILAPGYQVYLAEVSEEYGLGRFPNVITSLQLERLLSASGPTFGHVHRPSDQTTPDKIAFLQCIGSRDQNHDYCSAICCMSATKESIMLKEHYPELNIHIFMMDVRAFSKGYFSYFERAQKHYGVNYVRCRISALTENKDSHDLSLRYLDENGKLQNQSFNMVVLSVGMEISESVRDLGSRLGIELDNHGFCHTVRFNPIETNRPGIFAVGPFREPKDIPESVVEASGAAASAAAYLTPARFSLTTKLEFPPERDVQVEDPRIGVFVCHCGTNIAGYLNIEEVTKVTRGLPHVVHVEDNLYSCSQDSIRHITEQIKALALNRVVVASCTPLTHQSLFQDSLRAAGLNPYLFEMANIRNQCSWVHSNDRILATQKAKDLVGMSVARAAHLQPQQTIDVPVQQSALIVGGGAAGMTAALNLSEQGFTVHLVEKTSYLGGNLRHIYTAPPAKQAGVTQKTPQEILTKLVNHTLNDARIKVYLDSQVVSSKGFTGNFTTTINRSDNTQTEISHGITILATGAQEYRGEEYGFGKVTRVITQQKFEAILTGQNVSEVENVVMIQCVGPAEKYCSRICCSIGLKNALALKTQNPSASITILFRDMRTYGFQERLYKEARENGIIFFRYDDQNKPEVLTNGGAELSGVRIWDLQLRRSLEIPADLLVLSNPVVSNPDVKQLANIFKVSIDNNGFFLEAHVKLRPVDFSTNGIFMAGMAHYPKMLDEAMIQAQAAASRAARVLSRETLTAGGQVAVVDETLCTGCLTCVRICPFNVPIIKADAIGIGGIMGAACIEAAVCQGCGICAAECPARAIQLMHYTDQQLESKVYALLKPQTVNVSANELEMADIYK